METWSSGRPCSSSAPSSRKATNPSLLRSRLLAFVAAALPGSLARAVPCCSGSALPDFGSDPDWVARPRWEVVVAAGLPRKAASRPHPLRRCCWAEEVADVGPARDSTWREPTRVATGGPPAAGPPPGPATPPAWCCPPGRPEDSRHRGCIEPGSAGPDPPTLPPAPAHHGPRRSAPPPGRPCPRCRRRYPWRWPHL